MLNDDFERVKKEIDLVDYVTSVRGGQAKKVGGTWRISPCPTCGDQDFKHFNINQKSGIWLYKDFHNDMYQGSIIDFAMQYQGAASEKDALDMILKWAGMNPTSINNNTRATKTRKSRKQNIDFTSLIEELHRNIDKTTYFKDRGFSEEVINRHKLGYHEEGFKYLLSCCPGLEENNTYEEKLKESANKAEAYKKYLSVFKYFIPVLDEEDKCTWFLTRMDDDSRLHWMDPKNKNHNLAGFSTQFLNAKYLKKPETATDYIFIVEGWADCLTFETLGYSAIAINSTSNADKFIDLVKKNKKSLKNKTLIICGDNDESGRGLNKKLFEELNKLNIKSYIYIIPQYKDANEWLKADLQGFCEDLSDYIRSTEEHKANEEITKATEDHKSDIELLKYNFSDVGNAERLVELFGNDIRFSFHRNKWLVWDNKRWAIDSTGAVERMAKQTIRTLQDTIQELGATKEDEEYKLQIQKFVLKSENDNKIKAMVNQTKSQLGIAIKEDKLDYDGLLLNCLNGTLDLRTGELLPHSKQNLITKMTPIEYNPDVKCPNWLEFLDRIFMEDKELIEYLQRTVGYTLTGLTSEQCFYMLYGSGANGKSTFLNAVQYIMGDYAGTLRGSSLMVRKHDEGARGDLAKLKGSRYVVSSELNDNQTFDESLIKALTGEDTIPVRFLFGEEFDLKPEFKLWIATNEKPKIKGTNHGIWRRVRLIPFDYKIPEEQKDKNFFENVLKPEIQGILNWAIEGCLKWQREGISTPEKVRAAVDDYKNEMDILQLFIDDCCIIGPDKRVSPAVLYEAYANWCFKTGERELTQTKFGTKIKEKGFNQNRNFQGRFYEGIGVTTVKHQEVVFTKVDDNVIPMDWKK